MNIKKYSEETFEKEYGWVPGPWRHHSYIFPAIKNMLPKEKSVILDVGCGNGYLSNMISHLGHTVIGLDRDEEGIEMAKKAFPSLEFHVLNAMGSFELIGRKVDVVISVEVISHLYRPGIFLRNAWEILKPGGKLIISAPYHGYIKNMLLSIINGWDNHFQVNIDGGWIKFFSMGSISSLLQDNGFYEVCIKGVGRVPFVWKSIVCSALKSSS